MSASTRVTAQPEEATTTWAPSVWATLPAFAGFEPWLNALQASSSWPEVADYRTVLSAVVDFAPAVARLPAGLDASDVVGSYIGRCVDGVVPTRPHHLHDLMNALTWARYPLAKRALCQGQIEIAMARGAHTNRLRTRLQDQLAMLDEGGVLVVMGDADAEDAVAVVAEGVFGHGHLENAVKGRPSRGWPLVTASLEDVDVAAAIAAYIAHAKGPELTTNHPVSDTRNT